MISLWRVLRGRLSRVSGAGGLFFCPDGLSSAVGFRRCAMVADRIPSPCREGSIPSTDAFPVFTDSGMNNDNWTFIAFPRGASPRGGPAVGQWPGRLIWVEEIGGSSPSSWTRRPQHARYRPSGRHKRALRRKFAVHPAQGTRTPVAQQDRAPAYEAGGCRFESCRACCVRSRSGRCAGMWTRRKRVRAPPDTLRTKCSRTVDERSGVVRAGVRGSGPTGRGTWLRTRRFRVRIPGGRTYEQQPPCEQHERTDTEIADLPTAGRAHWKGGGTT